jgi:hypothetical protein
MLDEGDSDGGDEVLRKKRAQDVEMNRFMVLHCRSSQAWISSADYAVRIRNVQICFRNYL